LINLADAFYQLPLTHMRISYLSGNNPHTDSAISTQVTFFL
jgi:hypothetical protein